MRLSAPLFLLLLVTVSDARSSASHSRRVKPAKEDRHIELHDSKHAEKHAAKHAEKHAAKHAAKHADKHPKVRNKMGKMKLASRPFGQLVFDAIYPYWLNYATGSSPSRVKDRQLNAVAYDTYANWTSDGWQMYMHGYAYRQPQYSVDRIDALADLLLTPVGLPIRSMTPTQMSNIRKSTGDNFVVPAAQSKIVPIVRLESSPVLVATRNVSTNSHGDFAAYLRLPNTPLVRWGNHTDQIQSIPWGVHDATLNQHIVRAPAVQLVPHRGLTFVSDVDDILRVARIWRPSFAVMTLLAWDFTPWMNMPDIYQQLADQNPDAHFHYITICPEMFTPLYVNFLDQHYPTGSIDMRPMSGLVHPRANSHRVLFETFPHRKFVLVGDTSNVDLMVLYPKLVAEFPEQVQCILLRNTSATDMSDFTVPHLRGFEHVDPSKYMIFRVPDDLTGIDFGAGECQNATVSRPLSRAETRQTITPAVATLMHWAKKKLSCFWKGEHSDEFCQTIWTGDAVEEAWLHNDGSRPG